MDYLSGIANSGIMGILCIIPVVYIFLQACVFLRKAWRRGLEMGMDRQVLKKVAANSAVFSIIPSLPILLFLIMLTPFLGQFFPWLRLSVIGSGAYENLVANMAAQSFGLSGVTEGLDARVFLGILWCMTLGILWEPIMTLFGSKFVQKGLFLLKGKNAHISNTVLTSLMIALYCIFAGPSLMSVRNVSEGGAKALIPLIALLTGGLATLLFNKIAAVTKKRVFQEFSFPLSLIVGMAMAVLANVLL